MLEGIFHFWYPHFIAARWQTYLLYVTISSLTCKDIFLDPLIFLLPFGLTTSFSYTHHCCPGTNIINSPINVNILSSGIWWLLFHSICSTWTNATSILSHTAWYRLQWLGWECGNDSRDIECNVYIWSDRCRYVMTFGSLLSYMKLTKPAIRISEKVEQPEKHVPQVMCATMVIGILTTLPLLLLMMLFMTDIDTVVKSSLPGMELIYQM